MPIEHEENQRSRLGEILRGEQPHARNSAVLVGVVCEQGTWKTILIQRSETTPFAGDISFPGGKLEGKEWAEHAAFREAMEEIGLDPRKVLLSGSLPPSVAHFNKRKNNTKTLSFDVVENSRIRKHFYENAETKVYAIQPIIGLIPDETALAELKPNKGETLRIIKVPIAPLIQANQDFEAGKTDGMLKKIEKDGIMQYRFDIPDPDRQGETIEVRHITAGILHDFVKQFKTERDFAEFVLTTPMHQFDKEPGWKDRLAEGHLGNGSLNGSSPNGKLR